MISPVDLRLPESLIQHLQNPLGHFFKSVINKPSPEAQVIDFLHKNNRDQNLVVVVGDYVSKSLLENNFIPNVLIIDNYTQRTKKSTFNLPDNHKLVQAENNPGEINKQAWLVIKNEFKNLEKKPLIITDKPMSVIVILIKGEEDLLTLPVILEAPIGAYVLYGQPPMVGDGSSGIVLIEVTSELKKMIEQLLSQFDRI